MPSESVRRQEIPRREMTKGPPYVNLSPERRASSNIPLPNRLAVADSTTLVHFGSCSSNLYTTPTPYAPQPFGLSAATFLLLPDWTHTLHHHHLPCHNRQPARYFPTRADWACFENATTDRRQSVQRPGFSVDHTFVWSQPYCITTVDSPFLM